MSTRLVGAPLLSKLTYRLHTKYGLCADEFRSTDHMPFQLYVREARRMVGAWVFTQRDRANDIVKPDTIGLGSYNIDS